MNIKKQIKPLEIEDQIQEHWVDGKLNEKSEKN